MRANEGGGGAISVGCAVAGSYCAAAAKKAAVVAAAVAEAVAEAATEETEDGERGCRALLPFRSTKWRRGPTHL